jgi:hypothetical protein
MQKYFRGHMTRRAVKAKYGFEPTVASGKDHNQINHTQSDAQVAEARRLVMQIRASLEEFNYSPAPGMDATKRTTKGAIILDNGAEYEGEWDD